jgi:hypothetical protein
MGNVTLADRPAPWWHAFNELPLEVTVLHSADDPEQKLVILTPTAEDRARLGRSLPSPPNAASRADEVEFGRATRST